MLIEIRCDKFMDNGKVRDPIQFERGLNTILGASRASNSIGKSTFLMIIDFAFGGRNYVTLNNDVERNVEIHEIKFTFQFGERKYYFSRSTGDHTKEMECDEKHPLRTYQNDTQEAGIRRMIQLYGLYSPVGDLAAMVEDAEAKETTYKNAYKFQYIRDVTRQEDYKKNEARIAELQLQKEELARGSTQDLLDMDSVQAARSYEMKRQLANLRRQKTRMRSQLTTMKEDMEIDESSFKRTTASSWSSSRMRTSSILKK